MLAEKERARAREQSAREKESARARAREGKKKGLGAPNHRGQSKEESKNDRRERARCDRLAAHTRTRASEVYFFVLVSFFFLKSMPSYAPK
jgi:hypothetical protein